MIALYIVIHFSLAMAIIRFLKTYSGDRNNWRYRLVVVFSALFVPIVFFMR